MKMSLFAVFAIIVVTIVTGFAAGMMFDRLLTQNELELAYTTARGTPVAYAKLPNGHYTLLKVLGYNTAVVSGSTTHGEFFYLVSDLPRGMMEDGYKFSAGGTPEK